MAHWDEECLERQVHGQDRTFRVDYYKVSLNEKERPKSDLKHMVIYVLLLWYFSDQSNNKKTGNNQ